MVWLAVARVSDALAPESVTTLCRTFATNSAFLIHIERAISSVAELSMGRTSPERRTALLDIAARSRGAHLVRLAHLISIKFKGHSWLRKGRKRRVPRR